MRIADYSVTKAVLERHGFTFKKSFGQNFLTDTNILQKIVDTAEIDKNVNVIEIGPGIGALTEFLAENAAEVMAFEIDDRLVPILEDTLRDHDNVNVINEDVLKADLQTRVKEFKNSELPIKVVANLPYYITTPILMHLIESKIPFAEFVVMMQKDEDFLFRVAKASFVHRRKTLWNNLTNHFGKSEEVKSKLEKALEIADIKPSIRGEALSISDFAHLSDALREAGL